MAEEKIKELLELELFNDEQIEELASMDPDDHEFLNETLGDFLEQVDTGLAEMKGFRYARIIVVGSRFNACQMNFLEAREYRNPVS
jgi:hypothetical protein